MRNILVMKKSFGNTTNPIFKNILTVSLILIASLSRLIPHYPNFTSILAVALFSTYYFKKNHIAILISLSALWISDLLLNNIIYSDTYKNFTLFYNGFFWQYLPIILIAIIGKRILRKLSIGGLILSSLASSLIFFIISNFGVWLNSSIYSSDINGLLTCYFAAFPFFLNTLISTLVYSIALFFSYEFFIQKNNISLIYNARNN
mgnify:CR=1 FL=1